MLKRLISLFSSDQLFDQKNLSIDETNIAADKFRKQRQTLDFTNRERELADRIESLGLAEALPFNRLTIIVGAMKAGTTTLHHYLSQHPQLAPNLKTKEPGFFGKHRKDRKPDRFELGLPWYFSQWDFDPKTHKYALEASTNYTKYPTYDLAFERMSELPISYKFIYCLRDPIDRIESHVKHELARGRVRKASFNIVKPRFLGPSEYAKQISRILEYFPREDLHIVPFAELVKNPFTTMDGIHTFLGLEDYEYGKITPQNVRKVLVKGKPFQFDDTMREKIFEKLEPDIINLEEQFGFDVVKYFPTVNRIREGKDILLSKDGYV